MRRGEEEKKRRGEEVKRRRTEEEKPTYWKWIYSLARTTKLLGTNSYSKAGYA